MKLSQEDVYLMELEYKIELVKSVIIMLEQAKNNDLSYDDLIQPLHHELRKLEKLAGC